MAETTASQAYPNEPWNDHKEGHPAESLKGRIRIHPAHLSVDESEDFHDPFSDLNLFLARKIKREIQSHGSPREWSTKIENDLLSRIMPEFKDKFPCYRLGLTALKKTFDKVSYYYERLNCRKEAITTDGNVNVPFMIKENLRQNLTHKCQSELYPHNEAHRIAVKISECIAALDGERPSLESLTRSVWSSLKHLLKGVRANQIKSPYDDYDEKDKIIIKTMIHNDAKNAHLTFSELKKEIYSHITLLSEIPSPYKSCKLTTLISATTAYSFRLGYGLKCDKEEETKIKLFIERQKKKGKKSQEVISRLITLFSLSKRVKKGMSQTLFDYLNMELMLLDEEESQTLEDLAFVRSLTSFSALLPEELDIYLWSLLHAEESSKASESLYETIRSEIATQALLQKEPHFKTIVNDTIQYFKKAKEICADPESFLEKVELWAAQGEMVYKFLHFDSKLKLFESLESDVELVKFLEERPHLLFLADEVKLQAQILEKYVWYHDKANDHESSYDRFLKRHKEKNLENLVREKLPFMPFCPHYTKEQIAAE